MPGPTKEQLQAARQLTVPDLIGPGLRVLFVGINPGLYSAHRGQHFARPGNRFWKALHGAGLTPRLFGPDDQPELLALGLGITNVCDRTTATAAELGADELLAGARGLEAKVAALSPGPGCVAVLGLSAYRVAFDRPRATLGRQPLDLGGAPLWLLPNPSGLNASYQLPALIDAFRQLP